ncbi:MAG TPA: exonuclease domain-containing protein [Bacteriovoracaceae bacterium]|nr:exonuclease domain-containing protein [Bacteriovoracaceae bacterium]
MKPEIILPPKYYLSHFQEFLTLLRQNYRPYFEHQHQQFLDQFDSLTEDSKCSFIRMVNRKGTLFSVETLRYQEIADTEASLEELQDKNFVRRACAQDLPAILSGLKKEKLLALLAGHSRPLKKSWSKTQLVALAVEEAGHIQSSCPQIFQNWVVQLKEEELEYLMFLFFGKIQSNLTLYALRDLGIRKTSTQKTTFESRFSSLEEARTHYFFSILIGRPGSLSLVTAADIHAWPSPPDHLCFLLREEALLSLYNQRRESCDPQALLEILEHCHGHPGREKRARLLYQAGHTEDCLEVLHAILENPNIDEEYLFAEDFMARKFGVRKRSLLTETLRNAQKIEIDESYFRHPELGIQDHLKSKGIKSYFAENDLWNSLFGIFFWHELFESTASALFNEFERSPRDLYGSLFFERHEAAIRRKLELLEDKQKLFEYIGEIYSSKSEIPNGVFSFQEDTLELVSTFLQKASAVGVREILLHMAQDYRNRNTGYPDLMCVCENEVFFYEIKAEGDSLKNKQLKQLLALSRAGFRVEVIGVEYKFNPEQTYVVVDIETTGGSPGHHRITELGAVKVQGGKVIGSYQTLVNPERPIPRMIQDLTGISNQMVVDAPKFREVADAFNEFTRDAIFVAHNVGFDYGFIQKEFEKIEKRFVRPYICTKAAMRKYYPGLSSYGLKNLTTHFSIPLTEHHRAMCDALASAQLLFKINDKRAGL